jgi:long-subunit fatty acid transport protein
VKIMLLTAVLLAAAPLRADEGAAFLKLGTGPRATALGGAYTALGDDAASISWNPAGLARMDKREATASHAELVERTHFDFAAYSQPTAKGTFAAGLLYLSHGSFDGRDATGKPTGKVTAADTALSAAYANKSDWADYGVAVKFITSHIAEAQAQTAALDFGLKREVYSLKGGKVLAAGAIRNLNVGPGLRYAGGQKTDLPLQIAAGGAWVHERGALSFDLMNGPNGSGTDASFGGEYHVVKSFVVRAGYGTAGLIAGGSGFDAMRGLSFGIGFKTERVTFDYAVTPAGDLGQAHRFGVGVRF